MFEVAANTLSYQRLGTLFPEPPSESYSYNVTATLNNNNLPAGKYYLKSLISQSYTQTYAETFCGMLV